METENQLPQRTLTLIALITLTLADLFFSFFPISSVSIAAGIYLHTASAPACVGRRRRRRRRKEAVLHLREREHTHVHTYGTYIQ